MPLQIANPKVVAKVEKLARATGLTKTALVERAVDRLGDDLDASRVGPRIRAILARMDEFPDRPDAHDPLQWDQQGLPL